MLKLDFYLKKFCVLRLIKSGKIALKNDISVKFEKDRKKNFNNFSRKRLLKFISV